jgi:ABC-type uncharacterized transport system substrate-binding protein
MSKYQKWLGLSAIAFTLVVAGAVVQAQQPKKVPRIGYLSALNPATESTRAATIRLALRELGYIEGQNIAIEYRYAEGKRDQAPELAAELARLKVDIIVVAAGGSWIRAAMNATKTIPIVMVGGGLDPVQASLVESLARPGGNVTGITNLTGELGGKRLELLKDAVPKIARVAVLYEPATAVNILELKEVQTAARPLGLAARSWEVRNAADFERVFAALNKEHPDGLYVSQGPLMNANQKRIVGFALKSRLPSMYVRREFVEAGGLMSYGADLADSYRRVAYYIDKIRQNIERRQARRSTGRAADEVRASDQSENRQADWSDHTAKRVGAGGQSDSILGRKLRGDKLPPENDIDARQN